MAQPRPEPVDPASLPELARQVIAEAKFPMLATIDGNQPRVRPVSPLRVDGFTVYIANLRQYHKTGEIAANANVELAYLAPNHDQVRISGQAHVLSDRAVLDDLWQSNPLLQRYLQRPDNPDLIVYRVDPDRVRFMREWALEYHEVPLAPEAE